MIGDFDTILDLVGSLDDAPGDNTARVRFRTYLATGLTELGSIRDAIHTCTTKSGPQYARALQDLVNYLGTIIGFDVEYGRYQGVVNAIGHDGLWRSGHKVVVVEVKTTDAYTINTATLPNYVNSLKSEGRIAPDEDVIGLYVYAKTDPAVKQLEHAIIAEKRTQELRVGSVDAVLSLAELIREDVISHDEALAILWPSGVWIDDTVGLLGRIAAGVTPTPVAPEVKPSTTPTPPSAPEPKPSAQVVAVPTITPSVDAPACYLAPVADLPAESARETLERLLPAKVWAVSQGTPHRAKVKPGDRIAFYQASVGVVATAVVATAPQDKPMPSLVKDPEKYRWTFALTDVVTFLDDPIVIDAAMRASLDAFRGRDPAKVWSWFVFAFRLISERDYALLTGQRG
jgi:hypothetical protein